MANHNEEMRPQWDHNETTVRRQSPVTRPDISFTSYIGSIGNCRSETVDFQQRLFLDFDIASIPDNKFCMQSLYACICACGHNKIFIPQIAQVCSSRLLWSLVPGRYSVICGDNLVQWCWLDHLQVESLNSPVTAASRLTYVDMHSTGWGSCVTST